MRVAVLGESDGDEAFAPIIAEAILRQPVEIIAHPSLRTRGWPSIVDAVAAAMTHLHYRYEDGLIVLTDSDDSPVHRPDHVPSPESAGGCRSCHLRKVVASVQGRLRARVNGTHLRVAIGVAVPAIEAWYRCGIDGGVTEAAWVVGLAAKQPPYSRRTLKLAVYATDRPDGALQKRRAMEEARRLVAGGFLPRLELDFQNTFHEFAQDLRGW